MKGLGNTIDPTDMKRIRKGILQTPLCPPFDKLDKMDQFIERHKYQNSHKKK